MKRVLALTMCLVLLFLAGCSGGDSGSDGGASGTPSQADGGGQVDKDTMTMIFNGKITNYDPYSGTLSESGWLNNMLFDTIAEYRGFEGQVDLRLAEDYTVSEDGLAWTFNLKEGVTFHDGTPLTAEDVKVSIEAAMASPFRASDLVDIDRVEVTGDHQFILHTKVYNAETLGLLDRLYIVPGELYTSLGAEGYAEVLVGTGPYVLESIDDATSNVVLRANESYWDGEPAIKTINIQVITENSTRIVALENGEVNFNRIYATDYNILSENDSLEITEFPAFRYGYLIFNMNQEPCNDVTFRKAIAYALDYETINAVANGGVASTASSVFYKDAYGFDIPEVTEYQYDPDKAAELLAEAGISTPFELGTVQTIPAQKDVVELIQQNLAAVGVNIQIEQVEAATYVGNLSGGNFVISYMPAATAGNTIAEAYRTFFKTDASYNFSNYSNPEVDEAIDNMFQRADDSEMDEYVYQALRNIQEDLPVVNLFDANALCASTKGLHVSIGSGSVEYCFREFYWE